MPIFEVQGPDGKTYEADAPDAATAASAFATPKLGSQVPGPNGYPDQPVGTQPDRSLAARANSPFQGANAGIAGLAGIPVDAMLNLRDLGAAGLGMAQSAFTGKAPSDAFLPVDRSRVLGSSASFENGLNSVGIGTQAADPTDPVQRYLHAAGQTAPGAIAGGPAATARAALGGAAGQFVADQGGSPASQVTAQMLGNKTGISDAAKAIATKALTSIEASTAPRVRNAALNAQDVNPGTQTVAQTTGSPFLAKIGAGAAGSKTSEASANIVDQLAHGMTEQARAIAPLGVSNPEVAAKVQEVLQTKDQTLSAHGDAIYKAGKAAVARQPDQFATNNSVGAVDQMQREIADAHELVPPVVTTRLQNMMQLLRPTPATATPSAIVAPSGRFGTTSQSAAAAMPAGVMVTPGQPGGTSAAGFMELGKQINKLYDDVPSEAITPALNETFARLKAGWHADLAAAPDSQAKTMIQKTNEIFAGIQDQRAILKNSIVASVLGKDGKTSIANPDQVMDRIVGMKPTSQKYVRDILQQYSPGTLDSLRSYAINKAVQGAVQSTAPSSVSKTDIAKLEPGKLAETGLFTPEQAAELNKRQDAVNTALNALPQRGAPTPAIDPQAAGRMAASLSPTFLMGAVSKIGTMGKLETWLNTPEGRNQILGINTGGKAPPADVRKVIQMYQTALGAQVATDRQRTQQAPSSQPSLQ